MKHACKLCGRRVGPEQGAFCSDSCRRLWHLQCLPRLRRESVNNSGSTTTEAIKLAPGCYMKTNLQNQE